MSKKATTLITVDTEKLKSQKPGKIEDRSIIVMKDTTGSTDYSYDDPTKNDYKDKLIQKVDKGADREWTIEALNGKDDVIFVDFDCPDEAKLYQSKPVKDGKNKMTIKVKDSFDEKKKVKVWYTFKIEFEGNQFYWDPFDEEREGEG